MRLLKINTSQIEAIVFDLDDTLYPQIEFKRSGFQAVSEWATREFKLDRQTVWVFLEEIMNQYGPSYPSIFDRLAELMNLESSAVPPMVEVFIQHDPELKCYPGVIEMLARLRKIYGLGILTDGRNAVQRKKIHALGLESMMDEILCSDALGLEKPAGELFEWFETKFDMPGVALMYVGDNPHKDFLGGRSRGWYTVRVLSGEHATVVAPKGFGADLTITSLGEFEALVD